MAEFEFLEHNSNIRGSSASSEYNPHIWNGSAWVEHKATVYRRQTKTYLYNRGDACTDLTGGWEAVGMKCNTGTDYNEAEAPTLTMGNAYMTINQRGNAIGVSGIARTKKNIALSNYSTLSIVYKSNVGEGEAAIGISVLDKATAQYWDSDKLAGVRFYIGEGNTMTGSDGTVYVVYTVDISAIKTSECIAIGITNYQDTDRYLRVYEVYLE